jgi:hypothetical protein
MSATLLEPEYDIREMPAYLGVKADGSLTTGPDSKFIAQQIFSLRSQDPGERVTGFESLERYGEIERRLRELMKAPETDDFGPVRPWQRAFEALRSILFKIAIAGTIIPLPEDVDTDHDGHIRISWRAEERFLELVAPYELSEEPYIYHSQGATYAIDSQVSPDTLKSWLIWVR